ncbi:MAG TPA: hypothetical protein VLQ68_01460 [Rhizobiaceae bacterium]|nr:hypothetical protein [Rhizobiaceae bacterium]
MLDPRGDSHTHGRYFEPEDRGMQHDGAPALSDLPELNEPFPPPPPHTRADAGAEDNPLKKAMASVDLLQALDDVDADDGDLPPPGSLDDILLAELGPDADPEIPQAAAAIDRQLLLSRIVRARDAILAEEQQAARTTAATARPEPVPVPPALPLHDGPPFDSDIMPVHTSGGLKDALTLRRMALAVSVTALCIAAGWTLRSGEFPAFATSLSAGDMAVTGKAEAHAVDLTPVVKPVQREIATVSASVLPVRTPPPAEVLADRMAPAESAQDDAAQEVKIKERLIETHAAASKPLETALAPVLEPAAAPPALAPEVKTASISPVPLAAAAPAKTDPEPEPPVEAASVPRDPGAVETAMAAAALGLAELEPGQLAALKEKLVAGECPSTALAELLGRAPVVATRDLVLNLENGC